MRNQYYDALLSRWQRNTLCHTKNILPAYNICTIALSSENGVCAIGAFAAAVSTLTADQLAKYLPAMRESFMTQGAMRMEESEATGTIGPVKVKYDLYKEVPATGKATINIDTALTDTWYAYMFMLRCDSTADNITDYTSALVERLEYAKYTGKSMRFDFAQ